MFASRITKTKLDTPKRPLFASQRQDAPRSDLETTRTDDHNARIESSASVSSWSFGNIPIFPSGFEQHSGPSAASPVPNYRHPIQARTKIGAVNDPLEHEADRIADQLTRIPERAVAPASAALQISRQCTACQKRGKTLQRRPACSHSPHEAPSVVDAVLRSPGKPLDQGSST